MNGPSDGPVGDPVELPGNHCGAEPNRVAGRDLASRALHEVVVRHDFFADWFAGRLDEPLLEQCMAAFAPGFRHIGPDGIETGCRQLRGMLESRRATKPAGFLIGIEDLQVVIDRDDVVVVTYLEVQADGHPSTRVSTAVFESDVRAPQGVAWQLVQETWRLSHHQPEGERE